MQAQFQIAYFSPKKKKKSENSNILAPKPTRLQNGLLHLDSAQRWIIYDIPCHNIQF